MTMKKTEILIVGPTPPPYMGPAIATEMVLGSEMKRRFKLIHFDTSDRRDISNLGSLDFLNIWLTLDQCVRLIVSLVRYRPRIVYLPICQTVIGYLRDVVFIAAAKLFGARVIVHLRGSYFREMYNQTNRIIQSLIKSSFSLIHRVIVLGHCLRGIFQGLMPDNHILVVSNGISRSYITDKEYENKIHHANPGQSDTSEKKKILFLSNLIKSKGFLDVLFAVPDVLKATGNVRFIFAGAYWDSNATERIIHEFITKHGIAEKVRFTGAVIGAAKKDLLLSADIFLLPTYYPLEGQPWVIIEAMAAGLPIIATDHGCIKEMVRHGVNGYIVKKENPKEIAQRIIELLRDDNLRQNMGQKSRELFLGHHTEEHFINGLSQAFNDVLAQA